MTHRLVIKVDETFNLNTFDIINIEGIKITKSGPNWYNIGCNILLEKDIMNTITNTIKNTIKNTKGIIKCVEDKIIVDFTPHQEN